MRKQNSISVPLCSGLIATGLQFAACARRPVPADGPAHTCTSKENHAQPAPEQACRPTKRVVPVYPERARSDGIAGTVAVCFSIDGNGNVENAHVVHSDLYPRGYSYAKSLVRNAALAAIRQWKFPPAGTGGESDQRTACQRFSFSGEMAGFLPP